MTKDLLTPSELAEIRERDALASEHTGLQLTPTEMDRRLLLRDRDAIVARLECEVEMMYGDWPGDGRPVTGCLRCLTDETAKDRHERGCPVANIEALITAMKGEEHESNG